MSAICPKVIERKLCVKGRFSPLLACITLVTIEIGKGIDRRHKRRRQSLNQFAEFGRNTTLHKNERNSKESVSKVNVCFPLLS